MSYFKHPNAVVEDGADIGEGTRLWLNTHVQKGAVIGRECNICNNSFVENGVQIGNHVTIKHNVSVFNGVVIEDDVFIGSNIAFINDRYPRSHRQDEWVLEQTRVQKGATLGTNAVILCGVTIGAYAFVGAGSVVTRSVHPHEMVRGNPAKPVGMACHCGRKLDQNLQCVCGNTYVKNDEGLALK
jgi:acetyltransferase-like isoleucine patch superfamily enzyme